MDERADASCGDVEDRFVASFDRLTLGEVVLGVVPVVRTF